MHRTTTQPNPNREIRPLCSHVFPATDAAPTHLCGSPALRGQSFCFYHHPTRPHAPSRNQRRASIRARRLARRSFTLPPPTTRDELQRSLGQLIRLIAADQIDLRRASILLTALQTAGKSLS
ncbi:MAG: hypothetical protein ABSG84_00390 [Acidobacteriaceae bacterium]|jgi:hypothetical protein